MTRRLMTAVFGLALALGITGTAVGQDLTFEITGQCPGDVVGVITGATPDGDVALIYSKFLGSYTIRGPICAGIMLDLSYPKLLDIEEADENGRLVEDEDVGPGACGVYFQAVDLETCRVSNIAQIPE